MSNLSRLFGVASAALVAVGLSVGAAGAVTVLSNNGVYDIGQGLETEFVGDIKDTTGGPGSWKVTFNSSTAGAGSAEVTIGALVAKTFKDLVMKWESAGSTLTSTNITPVVTELSTVFTDPETLSQMLVISWSDSLKDAGFDVEVVVSAIPLPAAGLLLLGGLGGLGMVGRRRAMTA